MRFFATAALSLALLAGCQAPGLREYWTGVPLLEDDISVSEDRFAQFTELAVSSPEEDALAALDLLFDRMKEDGVAYYIYAEWMEAAFYNPLSPCRNVTLFTHAVNRIAADGILNDDECRPFIQKRDWMQLNQKGHPALVPDVVLEGASTLVLVLDASCPSCREALTKLGEDKKWEDFRKVAVLCGYGPEPEIPGWEYIRPKAAEAVFDIHFTPVYFTVNSDGIVTESYKLAI